MVERLEIKFTENAKRVDEIALGLNGLIALESIKIMTENKGMQAFAQGQLWCASNWYSYSAGVEINH